MEIEQATTYTLNALSFDERDLARGLTHSEQYDSSTGTAWWRSPSINLVEAINGVRARARADFKIPLPFINLYCDTLVIDDNAVISPEKETGRDTYSDLMLEIFTRNIVSKDQSKLPRFTFLMTKDSNLTFWAPKLPDGFKVTFTSLKSQPISYEPKIQPGKFGVCLSCSPSGSEINSQQYNAPIDAMLRINYLDRIDDKGNIISQQYLNDDLPRLLQFQMLVAQAHATLNKGLAVQLLYYIIAATNTKASVYMNLQANSMLSNLLLDEGVLSVPAVNVYSAKTILKSRLVAANAFEVAFRDFRASSGNLKAQTTTALNTLAKSQDAIQAYEFQRSLKLEEYSNAVKASKQASDKLDKSRSELDKLAENFDRGIQAWQKAEKEKATKEIIWQVLGAAASIGAVVASGGLAAPLAGMSLGALANGISKVAKVFQMLKTFYDKVKELLKKLEPVIKEIKKLVNIIMTVIQKLKDFKNRVGDGSTLKPDIQSTDPINATAEYDRFDITVRELEEGMKGYNDIAGKSEYFTALKMVVVDGKAAIATQANLVQRGHELAIVLVQKEVEVRDEKRLTAAVDNVSKDQRIADIMMRAMFDRVLSIRSLVYLDFFTFLTAYRYHTLSYDRIVSLSPVKPVVDYLEDVAALQGAITSYGSRELVQQRTFELQTLAGYNTAAELGTALNSGQTVQLSLSPHEELWHDFDRIRMSTARVYLEGLTPQGDASSSATIGVLLRTSRQFFDRDSTALAPPSFVGNSRTILFEYTPTTGAILCDGEYGQKRDYAKHTPMSTWFVRLVRRNSGGKVADWDFSKFTGLKIEFLCEFLWRGEESEVFVNGFDEPGV